MPIPAIAPAIAAAGANAGMAIYSAIQLKKDKAELSRLTPAFYKIQDEYFQNYNQAASDAQSGLTQGSKDYYTDEVSRGLGTGISGVLSAGGGPNDIAGLFDKYQRGIRGVAAEDSQKQLENIRYFMSTAKDLAGQKTIQWGVNEYQPYQNKLKELTQRIAADKQNIWGGIQGVVGAGQAAVTAGQNDSLLKGLFGDGKGGISDVADTASAGALSGFGGGVEEAFADSQNSMMVDKRGVNIKNLKNILLQMGNNGGNNEEQDSELQTILEQLMMNKNPNG